MAAPFLKISWPRQLILWLTVLSGLVLSFFALRLTRESIINRTDNAFQDAAATHIVRMQRLLTGSIEALYSVKSFYAASNEVERGEFSIFVQPTLDRRPIINQMIWAPRVFAQERAAFEESVHAQGFDHFQIVEIIEHDSRISASDRSEYFPVTFAEPQAIAGSIMGFDLASDPRHLRVLVEARDKGDLVILENTGFSGKADSNAVMAYLPIYGNALPHGTIEQKRQNLKGFVGLGFYMEALVQEALKQSSHEQLTAIEITDVTPGQKEEMLYQSASWPANNRLKPDLLKAGGTLLVAGRTWRVTCLGEPIRFTGKDRWWLGCIFLGGIGGTLLLAVYLYTLFSWSVRLESAVNLRTQTLEHLNQQLSQNIAQRELAEKERTESEQRYTVLFQNAPDPITLLNLKGVVEAVNPAAEQAVGYLAQELTGQHFATLPLLRGVFRRRAMKEFLLVAAGRKRRPFELELIKKDGTALIFEVNPSLIRLGQAKSIGIQVIFREITTRKHVEQALLQREQELKEKTATLENTLKELAYREKIMHSLLDDLQETNRRLALQQQSLQQAHYSLEKSHEDLKSTQLQLIQAAKLESVGRLAAGVAHEVKNPLAIILMGATYLAKHIGSANGPQTEVLKDITEAVKRADGVIKGLLEFSASKELTVHLEDVHAVIEQSLLLVKHELTKSHIEVSRVFADSLPKVNLDRTKIEQVFINLFTNAAHAMAGQGKGLLTIKTSLSALGKVGRGVGQRKEDTFQLGAEVVTVEIEDTGSGVPGDKINKVFDPFFTTKAPGQGTGLGLSVTKSIVDLHHGVIQLSNRPEGGARVTLLLPVER